MRRRGRWSRSRSNGRGGRSASGPRAAEWARGRARGGGWARCGGALGGERCRAARASKRKLPSRVEFGAMLEVPSLAEMLDQLLPRVDFLSIGTNDLTQFLFAADRADPRLAERYDWLSPAILRFLKRVMDSARAANVPVRMCGEMGGRPLEAMALIGIGAENFSITPAAVSPVKAMVRSLDCASLRQRVATLLAKPPQNLRKALTEWARRHSVA